MADSTEREIKLPREFIGRLTGPIARFLHIEAASGIVLLACTVIALALANSELSEKYVGFWKTAIGLQVGSFSISHSLKHWINDGLMAIFFFVVGLEVKRELVTGELRDFRKATLPFAAALGGMIVPAAIYLALQADGPAARGWGIPMATDIAFVVGCMALLGSRIPPILYVMLLSLAIVDDIGAILVIAIGYTESIDFTALILAIVGIGFIFLMGRIGVRNLGIYTLVGIGVWYGFHESGVHATIAGVILGLMTPARSYVSKGLFTEALDLASGIFHRGEWDTLSHRGERVRQFQRVSREVVSPLEYLEATLHPWVSFVVMPVFALANAGVAFQISDLGNPVAIAAAAGLVIGKPIGILLLSWLTVRTFLKELPGGLRWDILLGGACLAGIGFTMALFIASLALEGEILEGAKVGVLGGSAIAAALGMSILHLRLPKAPTPRQNQKS